MREHAGHEHGAQCRAAPGLRRAHHGEMSVGAAEVHHQGLLLLLQGQVEDADRHLQVPRLRPHPHAQAAAGPDARRAGQVVQRDGRGQRRQPYLMDRAAHLTQPSDDRGQLGRAHVGGIGTGRRIRRAGGWTGGLEQHDRGAGRPRRIGPIAGHMSHPEPLVDRLIYLQVRRARDRRQLVRVGRADDRAALRRAEGPQADPVRQMRVQPAQLAFLQPLRGHQQVHAQAAADPADLDEQVGELRAA